LANNKKRFNLFEFFNGSKDGPGVIKEEANSPRDIKFFFKLYWRNIGRICTANLYYIFGNFPIFFFMLANSGFFSNTTYTPINPLYSVLHGAELISGATPVSAALSGVLSLTETVYVGNTVTTLLNILGLFVLFTFGFVNVGTTYILRNIVKGDPIFVWTDFWYAIRRNIKQGLIMGILDLVFMVMIAFAVVFYYFNIGTFFMNVMFFFGIVLVVFYFLMRFYIYLMMITFDLTIWKILKNSFIFSLLNLKRNAVAALGIAVVALLNYYLLIIFLPLGIILPFIITLATCSFIAMYAAFPKVKQLMIDPYAEPVDESKLEDPIFKDMG